MGPYAVHTIHHVTYSHRPSKRTLFLALVASSVVPSQAMVKGVLVVLHTSSLGLGLSVKPLSCQLPGPPLSHVLLVLTALPGLSPYLLRSSKAYTLNLEILPIPLRT